MHFRSDIILLGLMWKIIKNYSDRKFVLFSLPVYDELGK